MKVKSTGGCCLAVAFSKGDKDIPFPLVREIIIFRFL